LLLAPHAGRGERAPDQPQTLHPKRRTPHRYDPTVSMPTASIGPREIEHNGRQLARQ
jgi:hypothetical protein